MNGNSSRLENPNEDIGYLIWRVSKYWQRGKHKILDEFGLTTSQLELLGAIYHMSSHNIEATQIILSQETDIDPMTTSTTLRNLERKGLIRRYESTTDTRARIVKLTDTGKDLFERAVVKLKNEQNKLFSNMDLNLNELKTQLSLLLKELDKIGKSDNK